MAFNEGSIVCHMPPEALDRQRYQSLNTLLQQAEKKAVTPWELYMEWRDFPPPLRSLHPFSLVSTEVLSAVLTMLRTLELFYPNYTGTLPAGAELQPWQSRQSLEGKRLVGETLLACRLGAAHSEPHRGLTAVCLLGSAGYEASLLQAWEEVLHIAPHLKVPTLCQSSPRPANSRVLVVCVWSCGVDAGHHLRQRGSAVHHPPAQGDGLRDLRGLHSPGPHPIRAVPADGVPPRCRVRRAGRRAASHCVGFQQWRFWREHGALAAHATGRDAAEPPSRASLQGLPPGF